MKFFGLVQRRKKETADLKGEKMKNLVKKMLLVVSALVITFGSVTMVSGCKKKEASETTTKETPKTPAIPEE